MDKYPFVLGVIEGVEKTYLNSLDGGAAQLLRLPCRETGDGRVEFGFLALPPAKGLAPTWFADAFPRGYALDIESSLDGGLVVKASISCQEANRYQTQENGGKRRIAMTTVGAVACAGLVWAAGYL